MTICMKISQEILFGYLFLQNQPYIAQYYLLKKIIIRILLMNLEKILFHYFITFFMI